MLNFVTIISAFFTAFIITYLVVPVIIKIACTKGLVDKPNERTSHTIIVPRLGGLGIFMGFMLSFTLFSDFQVFPNLQYFLFAMLLVFFLGMKDDVIALAASTKALGLLLAVSVLVILGDVRITSFHGIFGIGQINYWVSVVFTVFVFLTIINAVNLIDGINGLSSSLAIISALSFGVWLILEGSVLSMQLVVLIAALVGSLVAFMRFNVTPAKIFMGDTGSLMIGYILAFVAVMFIEINVCYSGFYKLKLAPVVAVGFLAIPLADMLKVFIIRIYRKKSPFKADKRHVHHLLVDFGLSHTQSTLVLSGAAIILIGLSLFFQEFRAKTFAALILLVALVIVVIPNIINHFRGEKLKRKNDN